MSCANQLSMAVSTSKASFLAVGFATVHNSLQDTRSRIYGLINAEAIRYATLEVNAKILPPDLQMGVHIFNDCGESISSAMIETTLKYTLDQRFWNNSTDLCDCQYRTVPVAVIGPDNSAGAKFLSELTASDSIPIISYLATSVVMENRKNYPSFFRTIPTDKVFVRALLDIVLHYGWSYISLLSTDNPYGWYGRAGLLQLFDDNNICVDLDFLFDVPFNKNSVKSFLLRVKEKRQSNVFVMFASSELAWEVFKVAQEIDFFGVTWILSDVTSVGEWLLKIDERITAGLIGAVPFAGRYLDFERHFWDNSNKKGGKWVRKFIRHYPEQWLMYRQSENLFYPTMLVASYIRNAIYAHAIAHKNYMSTLRNSADYKRKDYILFLANVSFQTEDDHHIQFDDFGNVVNSTFKIINVASSNNMDRIRTIGSWSVTRGLNITGQVEWPNGNVPFSFCSQECTPGFYPVYNIGKQCCWVCVLCRHGKIKPEQGNQPCIECQNGLANPNRTVCLRYKLIRARNTLLYKIACALSIVLAVSAGALIGLWIRSREHVIVKASNFPFSLLQLFMHLLSGVAFPLIYYMEVTYFSCVFRHLTNLFLNVGVVSILGVRAEALLKVFRSKVRITRHDVLLNKSLSLAYIVTSLLVSMGIAIAIIFTLGLEVRQYTYEDSVEKEFECDLPVLTKAMGSLIFIQAMFCGMQAFRSRHLPCKFGEPYCILSCSLFIVLILLLHVVLLEYKQGCTSIKLSISMLSFVVMNLYIMSVMFTHKTWLAYRDQWDQKKTLLYFTSVVFENVAPNTSLSNID